jgi:GTPase SAR1 family protein
LQFHITREINELHPENIISISCAFDAAQFDRLRVINKLYPENANSILIIVDESKLEKSISVIYCEYLSYLALDNKIAKELKLSEK